MHNTQYQSDDCAGMAPAHLVDAARARFAKGFSQLVNFDFVAWGEGYAELGLAVGERHMNMSGIIHGGVLTTLMDTAGAHAGNYIDGEVMRVLTLSLTTTFTGQADSGYIRVLGRRRAGGRRIFNSSIEIVDADERLLAMGEGTFRLRRSQ